MGLKYHFIPVVFLLCFALPGAFAQDTLFNGRHNKIGFTMGQGFQYVGQLNGTKNHTLALATNYYYKIDFYQFQYYFAGLRKNHFGIDILAQPQYNITKYKYYRDSDATPYLAGHEVGLSLGFLYRISFGHSTGSGYLAISTGPLFIKGAPDRQTDGFIFNNSLAAGVNLRLYRSVYADLRVGIRHISNLGFKVPNAGINNITMNEGLLLAF